MYIIRNEGNLYYAANKGDLPDLLQMLTEKNDKGLEATLFESGYVYFNSREHKTGQISNWKSLSVILALEPKIKKVDEIEEDG